ncbi:MAG: hypothetical protein R3D03_13335 [Geminicoccaceae bacterium]
MADPMRPSSPHARPTSDPCRAASSAYRWTAPAALPCAWHSRPASSTSDARRRRATSAPPVLLAVIAGMYAVYHGPEGLKRIARRIHRMAKILRAGLLELGFDVEDEIFFDAITVRVPRPGRAYRRTGPRGSYQSARDRPRPNPVSPSTKPRAAAKSRPCGRVFSRKAPDRLSVAAMDEEGQHDALPRSAAAYLVVPRSSGLPISITAKPRCFGTCAGCRPRISHSTGR